MSVPTAAATVRDAVEADLPRIAEIYGHYVLNSIATFEEEAPGLPEMSARFRGLGSAGFPWLVAETPDGIAGYAYAAPWRDRSAYRYVAEDSVYVAPGRFRQGVGTALLGELISRCTAAGMRQMIAVVGGSDNVASIGLHGRLGFRVAGVLASFGWKFGNWADAVLMTRALGEGDSTLPEPGGDAAGATLSGTGRPAP